MTLYEKWLQKAYDQQGQSIKKTWDLYLPLEQKIYEEILEKKLTEISGTVKELSDRFDLETVYMLGFLDGISQAVANPFDAKELEEDDTVTLEIDFEKLYRTMVDYKAKKLHSLPQWDGIFTEEQRKVFYSEQKAAGIVVRGEKIGRNDPCTCGSGKKYKRCCGLN